VSAQLEYIVALNSLVAQIADASQPAVVRIAATNIARTYLEAATRSLVEDAREQGASWLDIADVFATTERNIRARFDAVHDYDEK
jgi:Arc/MetJ family transcription regulator